MEKPTEEQEAKGLAQALAEGAAEKDPVSEFLPRFHRDELVPIKGYWFSVIGTTRGEGHLVLRMNGPTSGTLKKIAALKKQT
jgi:hypothetical protein